MKKAAITIVVASSCLPGLVEMKKKVMTIAIAFCLFVKSCRDEKEGNDNCYCLFRICQVL